MTPVVRTLLSSLLLTGLTMPSLAWQTGFEDVIRNLRNPDPKARLNAVRAARIAARRGHSGRRSRQRSDRQIQLGRLPPSCRSFSSGRPSSEAGGLVVEVPKAGGQAFEQGPLAAGAARAAGVVIILKRSTTKSARPIRGHLCARRRGATTLMKAPPSG
jgi:hypothetical protein